MAFVLMAGLGAAISPAGAGPSATAGQPGRTGAIIRDCPDVCPEMRLVPAGAFQMGSPIAEDGRDHQEGPLHKVTFARGFYVGTYEVTVGQFAAFVSETGYDAGTCNGKPGASWRSPGFTQDDTHPVVCVNFADAQAYLDWLSKRTGHRYRLPSEAEYEYANRAGTRTAFWWGPRVGVNHANCTRCGSAWDGKGTAPVGSFAPNPWGFFDTTGNVYVWVSDCWNDIYDNATTDGSPNTRGDCAQRGLRGGGWGSGVPHVRSAFRLADPAAARYDNMGLRAARDL